MRLKKSWLRNVFLLFFLVFALVLMREEGLASRRAQTAADDWPMYQHDPAHSGRTPATAYNDGPLYLQWAYAFGERIEMEAQPVVVDGVIYLGAMNGEMHAIDAGTGAARWIERPGGPIAHTAAVYDDTVLFGSLDGSVYALSTVDGSTRWQFQTGGPVISAPTVVDGRLYIGSNDGNLYALDADTGVELWRATTGAPVVSSPAVVGGRVYFGSEDMTARCVDAATGALIWTTPLHGAGMHNTHPIVSDDGQVVIFVTVKAGGSSYVPLEGYPNASPGANPVETWNAYYQTYPTRRFLYYLDATSGADLWDPDALRYVPLPIPYWGLLHPILDPDGSAWFPAPAGTEGNAQALDHDNRLFRVNLSTGVTSQVAGGAMAEFQLRSDEVGRHVFAGDDYYYTISEDLGVYHPASGATRALFTNGDPSGYNFGSHMHPHSPLPSRHLWRYGGAIAMGGVPGASPPIVANGAIYFASYGWLYAVGPTDRGYDPALSFPARDARLHELTYSRQQVLSLADVRAEVEQRVADILALGPDAPPLAVRWEQPGDRMLSNEFTFELYGFEADLVRVLSEAYPHLSGGQQAELKSYLSDLVARTLLNEEHYAYRQRCLHFGQTGIQTGDTCTSGQITCRWYDSNPNLVGLRLYGLWAYADATGDWDAIQNHWSLITQRFQMFVDAYDSALGFCNFEEWRVGRLNIGAQIVAAEGVRNMAAHLGDTATQNEAQTLLDNLLAGRVDLADFVPSLYDSGLREPAQIRLNADGTINNDDIMGPNSPYNAEMIPHDAALRDRDTDPSQVNWWDGNTYRVDVGIGFMYYPALSGYFPLSSELIARLRADLLDETRYYVKSYEVNNPWWWLADLAHHTTGSGEHLYHSPTLSWTLFQVKAWILQEEWESLARQLPEPVSFNSRYDLYRLQNLVTLLSFGHPMEKNVSAHTAQQGDTLTYAISFVGTGEEISVNDPFPAGTAYVDDSAEVDPDDPEVGALTVDDNGVAWNGAPAEHTPVEISFQVTVTTAEPAAIINEATVNNGFEQNTLSTVTIANGFHVYLPLIMKER